jgi:hypothetical protein
MRYQDVRLSHGEKRLRRFALQISDHAPRHILDIERPLAQIRIVDFA